MGATEVAPPQRPRVRGLNLCVAESGRPDLPYEGTHLICLIILLVRPYMSNVRQNPRPR